MTNSTGSSSNQQQQQQHSNTQSSSSSSSSGSLSTLVYIYIRIYSTEMTILEANYYQYFSCWYVTNSNKISYCGVYRKQKSRSENYILQCIYTY